MNALYTLTHPVLMRMTLYGFCAAFMAHLNLRSRPAVRAGATLVLFLLSGLFRMYLVEELFWTEIVSSVLLVFATMCIGCRVNLFQAVYGTAWVLVTHQLTLESWIILYAFTNQQRDLGINNLWIGLFCQILVCIILAGTVARWLPENGTYKIGPRQFLSALALLIIFEIDYSLLLFRGDFPNNVFLLITLYPAQVYCVCTLYFQNALFRKSDMKRELELMERLRHEQKQQYDLARENIAIINRKCHDLKHQMAAMRTMVSPENHEKYLAEIEKSVRIYDSILKTGNEVLDTVLTEKSLYCEANHIAIHCVADGAGLEFIDAVDLYTVFGNALDNAIECVQQMEPTEQRMIDVLICREVGCLVVHIRNSMEGKLDFVDGLPRTTKEDNGYHGYGLKSIRHTVEQYGGHMNVKAENGWFSLKLLIPIEND